MNTTFEHMHSVIQSALSAMDDLPEALRAFALTRHETDVLQSLEGLLESPDGQALFYFTHPVVAPRHRLTPATLNRYHAQARSNAMVLRWALLLHDLAKGRTPARLHPEAGADLATRLRPHIEHLTPELSPGDIDQIIRLVRYHSALGNLYTGELAPQAFIGQIALSPPEIEEFLELLHVVTLCDLMGTDGGRYLTEEKARFWLSLRDTNTLAMMETTLFDLRIRRWSGDLLGIENAYRADRLLRAIDARANADAIQDAFGKRITQIAYGYYLFVALAERKVTLLADLMADVTDVYGRTFNDRQAVSVRFEAYHPFDLATQHVIEGYRTRIKHRTLQFAYDRQNAEIIVPCQ